MRNYFKTRRLILRQTNIRTIQVINNSTYGVFNQNENRKKTEKNAIKLVLVMCLVSLVTRCASVACDVYYLYYTDYIATLLGRYFRLGFSFGTDLFIFCLLLF